MATVLEQVGTTTRWNIDPSHSQVGFAVRHMMMSTVRGRFESFEGEIVGDEADAENSSVSVTIDASSISTNDPKRDEHLRSADFLDVETYPTITFQCTSVENIKDGKFVLKGDLTIHGVTRPISIKAEQTGRGVSPWGYEVIGFEGQTTINRKEFGLTWNAALETGGVLVGEDVKITLDLEAIRQ
jgi:polyisoprenoid-binding protein YceI